MRFAFMDESGNETKTRHLIVAGVIVHADTQLIPLENKLREIAARYIPQSDLHTFVFRASDIVGGNGWFKGKDAEYPLPLRLKMLSELASVPGELNLPVVYGHNDRERHTGDGVVDQLEPVVAVAFRTLLAHLSCTVKIEQYMRNHGENEIAQLVAEDNQQNKRMILFADKEFRNPSPHIANLFENHGLFPFHRIRGSVQFCGKTESLAIQIADVCAYLICAKHRGKWRVDEAFELLRPALHLDPIQQEVLSSLQP